MLICIYTRKIRHNCEKSNLKYLAAVRKNLVLLGMMGVGKSTIGKIVAKKLNLKFIDTDLNIEKKRSMKISEIFEKKGEVEFRNLEKKVALKFLNKPFSVISLGGGAFINEIIKEKVKKKGITVWLKWDSQTLINRIRKNKKKTHCVKFR